MRKKKCENCLKVVVLSYQKLRYRELAVFTIMFRIYSHHIQEFSSTCKTQHSHFIFIFSSDVYVLIINDCVEVSQLSKPRVSDIGTTSEHNCDSMNDSVTFHRFVLVLNDLPLRF